MRFIANLLLSMPVKVFFFKIGQCLVKFNVMKFGSLAYFLIDLHAALVTMALLHAMKERIDK